MVDARFNWWGSADVLSSEIHGDVVYEPWLGDEFTQPFTFNSGFTSASKFSQAGGWTVFTVFMSEEANWSITITNAADQVVRTFSGSGDAINQEWYGDDNSSSALPDGIYTYKIEATSINSSQAASPLIGKIELQADAPIAKIITPVNDDILTGNIDIIGIATDSNFTSYTVEYGNGAFPVLWNNIATSSTAVDNNLLATWNSVTDSYLNGTYSIRLTVIDTSGNVSIDTKVVELNNLQITDVSLSSIVFDPIAEETTNISYVLNRDADVTVGIYDEATRNLVRTLLNSQPQSAGANNVNWDGRGDFSVVLPMDAYYFVISAAEDINGSLVTYNDAVSPIYKSTPTSSNLSVTPLAFDSYKNEIVEITYTLSDIGRMSVVINPNIKTLSNFEPRLGGVNVELWDGRDENGDIYNGSYDVFFDIPQSLPRDVIILRNATLEVPTLQIEPYLIVPADSQISTIYYELINNCFVSMEIYDSNGNYSKTLISHELQNAGSHNLEWDGTNDDGDICSIEGDYRVKITIEDQDSNYSITKTATIYVTRN